MFFIICSNGHYIWCEQCFYTETGSSHVYDTYGISGLWHGFLDFLISWFLKLYVYVACIMWVLYVCGTYKNTKCIIDSLIPWFHKLYAYYMSVSWLSHVCDTTIAVKGLI